MAINDVECCEAVHIHSDVLEKINMDMPDEDELYDLAELFKVFGDSTRIRILYVLFESEACVCDIATALNMNQLFHTSLEYLSRTGLFHADVMVNQLFTVWLTNMYGLLLVREETIWKRKTNKVFCVRRLLL